jgi:N-acetylmuramoyl-L-alanine amidase
MNIVPITVWREARGEGQEAMLAVYHAILNRAAASPANGWPSDPEKVCLQAFQFSCWNSNDVQRNLYPQTNDPQYSFASMLPATVTPDPTGGATAYFDKSIQPPAWATPDKFTVQIGRLKFYKL